MNASSFWDNVLEPEEKLLWAGRPKPRLHWRNWRLYGPAPLSASGLLAAWFIIFTTGSQGDMWLLILPALLIIIPARATLQQLKTYKATRYALTDKRALFFRVSETETHAKAYPPSAMTPPTLRQTVPPSVGFLHNGNAKSAPIGFDYIETAEALLPHLNETGVS
ncbi:hypothetical protein [Sulfitobacter donghicola]|uniref:Aspartate carbamoyltransferase catalytic subunit n=1 Tax=Sulfitobacter donghicola DSW-25 = KCTC 12864 = JCM 14565 TaxID=1300350 RepID=A0A073IGR4_9RHOB|nr:hypothetical protein [Sulfitobacter donghicola]KEJ88760.1 hypothetical protein DSW25_14020 [Sulfitobacter donghicola DSW-25 = KCTC 12864 = JCM 14565]KIN68549.1 hypothetical protein Z948_2280 [Sulfitobacter donghicola DSW-25 = KCTC 12864 = JCM 14565]